jgi:hypothetical protein
MIFKVVVVSQDVQPPIKREFVDLLCAADGMKRFIIQHVKLGTDVASTEMANHAHSGGMLGGEAHKLALSSSKGPFWKLVAISQPRINHKRGATPNSGTPKVSTVHFGAGKNLHGC